MADDVVLNAVGNVPVVFNNTRSPLAGLVQYGTSNKSLLVFIGLVNDSPTLSAEVNPPEPSSNPKFVPPAVTVRTFTLPAL